MDYKKPKFPLCQIAAQINSCDVEAKAFSSHPIYNKETLVTSKWKDNLLEVPLIVQLFLRTFSDNFKLAWARHGKVLSENLELHSYAELHSSVLQFALHKKLKNNWVLWFQQNSMVCNPRSNVEDNLALLTPLLKLNQGLFESLPCVSGALSSLPVRWSAGVIQWASWINSSGHLAPMGVGSAR